MSDVDKVPLGRGSRKSKHWGVDWRVSTLRGERESTGRKPAILADREGTQGNQAFSRVHILPGGSPNSYEDLDTRVGMRME